MPQGSDGIGDRGTHAVSASAGRPSDGRGGEPAAPQISLPKGGGAIRGIGEKFAANRVGEDDRLSDAAKERIRELADPKNLKVLAAVTAVVAAANATGGAEVVEAAAALLLGKEILEVSGEVVGSLVMAVFADDDDDFDEAADLMAHGLSRAGANVAQAAAGCGLGKAIGKLLPKKKGGAPAAEPEPGAPAPEGGTAGSKSAKPLSEQGPGTPAKPNAPA